MQAKAENFVDFGKRFLGFFWVEGVICRKCNKTDGKTMLIIWNYDQTESRKAVYE